MKKTEQSPLPYIGIPAVGYCFVFFFDLPNPFQHFFHGDDLFFYENVYECLVEDCLGLQHLFCGHEIIGSYAFSHVGILQHREIFDLFVLQKSHDYFYREDVKVMVAGGGDVRQQERMIA